MICVQCVSRLFWVVFCISMRYPERLTFSCTELQRDQMIVQGLEDAGLV